MKEIENKNQKGSVFTQMNGRAMQV